MIPAFFPFISNIPENGKLELELVKTDVQKFTQAIDEEVA